MIEIYTEVLPQGWHWSPYKYLGGTPEFVVETATEASKFNKVIVYYDGRALEHNGVTYLPRKYFQGKDVVLACNSVPHSLGKHSIMWSNWYGDTENKHKMFCERITQSPFHQSMYGMNSRIVQPSIRKENLTGGIKTPKRCLYSSSPDRGGNFLKDIWSEVRSRTGAELITTYDVNITSEQMDEEYKKAQFWLHPCQGIELFCIAGAKAQVAGCIPVVVPNMALETTIKYGVKTTIERYKEDLINAINNPPAIEAVDFGSWEAVTKDLFKEVL
jgi:hypothetical protein